MLLKDILRGVGHKASRSARAIRVKGITCDSRAVGAGSVFVAYRGFAEDGYKYIPQAIGRGAKVVLAERDFEAPESVEKVIVDDTRTALPVIAANFYGHPSENLRMTGITGTNGKTTITYILENILSAAGRKCGVIGTVNYRYGCKIVPAKNTTPGPLELQALLECMRKNKVRQVIMEVSSHSLDQGRVNGISFDHAVFTNFTQDHLDYHKTMGSYFKAKVKIFSRLKKGGAAILNYDDRRVRLLCKKLKGRVLTYGLSKGADIRAKDIELSIDGSIFTVETPGGSFAAATKLIGRHNISNILAAVAVAYCEKISMKVIAEGVNTASSAPGRLEPVSCGQPFKVFVDFAHTQDALSNILGLLRDVAGEARIVTVFGCGGNRDKTKRPLMGKTACELSDLVVVTSDNPRHEDPDTIIRGILGGIRGSHKNFEVVVDRRSAIGRAMRLAMPNDIVVIAGKGHEKYQVIGDVAHPFDDLEVAQEMLGSLPSCRGRKD